MRRLKTQQAQCGHPTILREPDAHEKADREQTQREQKHLRIARRLEAFLPRRMPGKQAAAAISNVETSSTRTNHIGPVSTAPCCQIIRHGVYGALAVLACRAALRQRAIIKA
jgi:hypothetical protein